MWTLFFQNCLSCLFRALYRWWSHYQVYPLRTVSRETLQVFLNIKVCCLFVGSLEYNAQLCQNMNVEICNFELLCLIGFLCIAQTLLRCRYLINIDILTKVGLMNHKSAKSEKHSWFWHTGDVIVCLCLISSYSFTFFLKVVTLPLWYNIKWNRSWSLLHGWLHVHTLSTRQCCSCPSISDSKQSSVSWINSR